MKTNFTPGTQLCALMIFAERFYVILSSKCGNSAIFLRRWYVSTKDFASVANEMVPKNLLYNLTWDIERFFSFAIIKPKTAIVSIYYVHETHLAAKALNSIRKLEKTFRSGNLVSLWTLYNYALWINQLQIM